MRCNATGVKTRIQEIHVITINFFECTNYILLFTLGKIANT